MARALRGSGLAVYAAELPGHDLAAENEPFAPMAQVVEQACAEITRLQVPRVLLWGHSSGAAFALATAAKLGEAGVNIQRVFVAAQLPGDAADRRASITDLTGRSDAEIAAELTTVTGAELTTVTGAELTTVPGAELTTVPGAAEFRAELGELDAPRAEQIGAAYRHDCVSAHRWIADALDRPPAVKLSAPVTVVVAADDPYTAGSRHRYREWQLLADQVNLHELADGGHYFLRTRPAQAAQAVLRADGWSASS
jgi:surfactin synthase thioesterase subunit